MKLLKLILEIIAGIVFIICLFKFYVSKDIVYGIYAIIFLIIYK